MPSKYERIATLATIFLALLLPIIPLQALFLSFIFLLFFSLYISWKSDFILFILLLFLSTLQLGLEYYILGSSILLASLITLLKNPRSSSFTIFELLLSFLLLFSFISILILLKGNYPNFSYILFLSVVGGMSSTLLDLITRKNKESIILLGSSMSMWLFVSFGHSIELNHLLLALVLSLGVGYLSYRSGATDEAGMISGALLGIIVILFSDLRWFILILIFFFVAGVFTKYKYEVKLSRGMAEDRKGRRSYNNVFGNGIVPTSLAILYGLTGNEIFSLGFIASLSTVTADTLGSEIGGLSQKEPRMITNFRRVPYGTNGAISPLGEVATIFGALMIVLSAFLLDVASGRIALIAFISGVLGAHVDSLLGATLETRGKIGNSTVNFLASLSGSIISFLLYST